MITKHYDSTIEMAFDESKHVYLVGQDRVPGVTGITGIIAKDLTRWAAGCSADYIEAEVTKTMDGATFDSIALAGICSRAKFAYRDVMGTAQNIGKATHDFAEQYGWHCLNGTPMPEHHPNKIVRRCCEQFIGWWKAHKIEPIAIEFFCLSKEHKFAGQSDLDCMMDGKRTLVDYKTSKGIYPDMGRQLAAYGEARKEELGIEYEQHAIACFPKQGLTFEERVFKNIDKHLVVFLKARELYAEVKQSRGKWWGYAK